MEGFSAPCMIYLLISSQHQASAASIHSSTQTQTSISVATLIVTYAFTHQVYACRGYSGFSIWSKDTMTPGDQITDPPIREKHTTLPPDPLVSKQNIKITATERLDFQEWILMDGFVLAITFIRGCVPVFSVTGRRFLFPTLSSNISDFSKAFTWLLKWNRCCPLLFRSLSAPGWRRLLTVMVSELEGCTLLLPDLEFFFQAGLLFPSSAEGATPSRYTASFTRSLSFSMYGG